RLASLGVIVLRTTHAMGTAGFSRTSGQHAQQHAAEVSRSVEVVVRRPTNTKRNGQARYTRFNRESAGAPLRKRINRDSFNKFTNRESVAPEPIKISIFCGTNVVVEKEAKEARLSIHKVWQAKLIATTRREPILRLAHLCFRILGQYMLYDIIYEDTRVFFDARTI
ncbi:unnamed protein product, partial [Trichogramma brassicae]